MDAETKTLVAVLRERMEKMTDEERVELIGDLKEGYCQDCGRATGEWLCHCMNDE